MAAFEITYSMSRCLISASTYLTSAQRVCTLLPNLVQSSLNEETVLEVDYSLHGVEIVSCSQLTDQLVSSGVPAVTIFCRLDPLHL